MIEYRGIREEPDRSRPKISQRIYALDIEVTTLLNYRGTWRPFDPAEPAEETRRADKAAIPYIWQFGVENRSRTDMCVYYGRDFRSLQGAFEDISDPKTKKIIWVFNLSYEFEFLLDFLPSVEKMIARRARHPIRCYIPEWNIELRCAYVLTNLSLKDAADAYGCREKLSGDEFDYNEARSPLTELTDRQMLYCEYDILSLYDVICYYRKKYKRLQWIPLTSTGEVRKEFRKRVDFAYIRHVQDLVPWTPEIFLLLMKAFMGGITHGMYLKINKLLLDYVSGDIASSYPAVMCSDMFPVTAFRQISPEKLQKLNLDKWAALIHVKWSGIDSKLFNHYILKASCVHIEDGLYDNGRLISADVCEMVLTDVDYQIIKRCYSIQDEEVKSLHVALKGYLPKEFISYVLEMYGRKTSLKGVDGMEEVYRDAKNRINALFGVSCTNIIKGSCDFINGIWVTHQLTLDFIKEKLDELRRSKTNAFPYQYGVWITAYARRRLWEVVEALDPVNVGYEKSCAYYDTDSCKAPDSPEFRAAMEKSNAEVDEKLRKMCAEYDLDFELTRPKDPKGKAHPLGHWEIDGRYKEFKTLGAKRYAYEDDKGLHITIAGVNPKKGVKALSCVDDLKKNMRFGYAECGKMTSYHMDCMVPVEFIDSQGKPWSGHQKHGIALVPTVYNLSIDPAFESLYEQDLEKGDKIIG